MNPLPKKSKYKKPLTCPVCNKRFYYSAKQHPLGRLSKHLSKDHPRFKRKPPKKKGRYTDAQEEDLLDELQLVDDIMLQQLSRGTSSPIGERLIAQSSEPPQHDFIGGVILAAATYGAKKAIEHTVKKRIKEGVAKRKAKRK